MERREGGKGDTKRDSNIRPSLGISNVVVSVTPSLVLSKVFTCLFVYLVLFELGFVSLTSLFCFHIFIPCCYVGSNVFQRHHSSLCSSPRLLTGRVNVTRRDVTF